jgi:hypothetical protein
MKSTNILMLLAVIIISACSKNGNEPGNIKEEPVVKPSRIEVVDMAYEPSGDKSSSSFYYDENGKLYLYSGDFRWVAGFSTVTINVRDRMYFSHRNNVGIISFRSYALDAQGRVAEDHMGTYKYNSDGYLAGIEVYDKRGNFTFSYTDGNLNKIVADGNQTSDITYYEDANQSLLGFESPLTNPTAIAARPDVDNFTSAYTGKRNKNLLKAIVTKYERSGHVLTIKQTNVYTKDANGKIVKLKVTIEQSSEGNAQVLTDVQTYTFGYSCNW